MAKSVFRPGEMKNKDDTMMLPLVHNYEEVEEVEEEVVEEYTGPTADDLRREAEAFKVQWEEEKQKMINEAQAQAEQIIKTAQENAAAEIQKQTAVASGIKANAEKESADIISKANSDAAQIIKDAQSRRDEIEAEAKKSGYENGREEGYKEGNAESDRLISQLHRMLEGVMHRREEILKETETQIVELVILISRKVVKLISENQKNVVLANVMAALEKLHTRGEITLRVNIEDVKLTTEHADEFIKHVENVQSVKVLEDSSVEKGGCIVETDFGAIDARISSQLTELENKIIDVSPVKNIKRSDPLAASID